MIGYGELMLERRERLEEFHWMQNNDPMRDTFEAKGTPALAHINPSEMLYMGDYADGEIDLNAVYYATGYELKEAVNTAVNDYTSGLVAKLSDFRAQRNGWRAISIVQSLIIIFIVVLQWLS